MEPSAARYCTKCGNPLAGTGRFCTRCGAPQPDTAPAAATQPSEPAPAAATQPAPAAAQAAPATAQRAASAVARTASIATTAAGAAQMAAVLPWQTIIAGQTPDLSGMLGRLAMPGARTLAQRSLRKPGLAMAITTVLDLLVAGISGGAGAFAGAIPRALGGGLTAALSLITGSKGGALRNVTGIVSLVTALVQVVSIGITLVSGLMGGSSFLTLAPMAVATVSALVMAIKTASVALRRRS